MWPQIPAAFALSVEIENIPAEEALRTIGEIFLLLSLIANRRGRNNAPAPERETTAGNANLS